MKYIKKCNSFLVCIVALFLAVICICIYKRINAIVLLLLLFFIGSCIVFYEELKKYIEIDKKGKVVYGKVILSSLKKREKLRGYFEIKVDISYFDTETEQTILFKGKADITADKLERLNEIVEVPKVCIKYIPNDIKKYIVNLDELFNPGNR